MASSPDGPTKFYRKRGSFLKEGLRKVKRAAFSQPITCEIIHYLNENLTDSSRLLIPS
jgi:hypothetical protein